MANFLTGLFVVSDPDKDRQEAEAKAQKELEELEAYLSKTRPLLLTTKGREAVLAKIRELLA